MAEKLDVDDLETLRRWMAMSAEEMSVHAGAFNEAQRGAVGGVALKPSLARGSLSGRGSLLHSIDSSDRVEEPGSSDTGGSGARNACPLIRDPDRNKSLEVLYLEMSKVGESSVRLHGGRGGFSGGGGPSLTSHARKISSSDLTKVEEDRNGVGVETTSQSRADSSPPNSGKPPLAAVKATNPQLLESGQSLVSSEGGDSVQGGRASSVAGFKRSPSEKSFLSVAHLHGLCSLDELIAACHSTGCEDVASDLEVVKTELRNQRVKALIDAGVKKTDSSNALLDTMLFRYDDLFQKVVTTQVELRRRSVSVETGDAPAEAQVAPSGVLTPSKVPIEVHEIMMKG